MGLLRILLLILSLFSFAACATAQPGGGKDISSLKKKDQRLLAEARSELDLGNFTKAKEKFDGLISGNPDQSQLYYLRSISFKEMGDFPSAIEDVRRGMAAQAEVGGVVYRELGELYSKNGQFEEAVGAFELYASSRYATAREDRREKAEVLLKKAQTARSLAAKPVPFNPVPVAGGVNTQDEMEYFPSLSIDGQNMVFTRRVEGQQEDFFISTKQEDGTWSEAEPLDGVNTEFNEGAQSITADGNYLVFTACDRLDGAGSCDLYYSERNDQGNWSAAKNIGPEINTRDYEAQPSISADGTLLFFASRRPGGFGGADLYLCGRLPSGKWSRPVNLGPTVNTAGDELYPFWSPDGTTLYFTSDGHPGLGGADIFRSGLSADNKWMEPVNLGYPINTAGEETNLFIAPDGKTAYFSKGSLSVETGKMDVDIYQFELPETLRPAPVTYVKARVTDAVTGRPLAATVRLRDLTQTAPPSSRQTGTSGSFLAVLPVGKDYAFTVDLEGYMFYADRFSLAGERAQIEPYLLDIALQPIKKDAVPVSDRAEPDGAIAFRNVLFSSGSAKLLAVSGDELDRLAALLKEAPDFTVEIVGHTDDVGDETTNLRLSQERAAAVKDYLIEQGVEEARISTRGEGEAKPVAGNETEEGRARNRRTTFKLVR
ncbi:OmpA family protein [Neolewinella aurantiaca]|uniref:OmpA family protein n=1 Tax=Neolewinella aurantiaca TaxID=2602767 RepID=A0A5C7FP21_9BACT|nr:OmpA family protein [Neolewinella aurantiaca]TXF89393.1 OmpA family protein [Neolewinella aurantiaca]